MKREVDTLQRWLRQALAKHAMTAFDDEPTRKAQEVAIIRLFKERIMRVSSEFEERQTKREETTSECINVRASFNSPRI